jgi:hypothetical protein
LVLGREVRPRRAREAFCRCAQALFIAAMPILKVGAGPLCLTGKRWEMLSGDGRVVC